MNEKEYIMWLMGYFDGLDDFKGKTVYDYQEILENIKDTLENVEFEVQIQDEKPKKQLLTESHIVSVWSNDLNTGSYVTTTSSNPISGSYSYSIYMAKNADKYGY